MRVSAGSPATFYFIVKDRYEAELPADELRKQKFSIHELRIIDSSEKELEITRAPALEISEERECISLRELYVTGAAGDYKLRLTLMNAQEKKIKTDVDFELLPGMKPLSLSRLA